MKKKLLIIKIVLAICLALCLNEVRKLEETQIASSIRTIAGISFTVIMIDLLTLRWRTKWKVIKKGVCLSATIAEISRPFDVVDSEEVTVTIGGKSRSGPHIIHAVYVYEGIRCYGSSGLQFGGCDFKAGDCIGVFIDPAHPERFYLE